MGASDVPVDAPVVRVRPTSARPEADGCRVALPYEDGLSNASFTGEFCSPGSGECFLSVNEAAERPSSHGRATRQPSASGRATVGRTRTTGESNGTSEALIFDWVHELTRRFHR